MEASDKNGWKALHDAISYIHVEIVKVRRRNCFTSSAVERGLRRRSCLTEVQASKRRTIGESLHFILRQQLEVLKLQG